MPFCPVCDKYFERKTSLRQHVNATDHHRRGVRGTSLARPVYLPFVLNSIRTGETGDSSLTEACAAGAAGIEMSDEATEFSFDRMLPAAFNCSDYSDTMLILGGDEANLPAHRLVLASRSQYFRNAFKHQTLETMTREFRFKDYSTHALWRVFQYMYINSYSDVTSDTLSCADDSDLMKHPRVYFLADMFQMQDLKWLAARNFRDRLRESWNSESLPDCINEVYHNTTDSKLTSALTEILILHIGELNQQERFIDTIRAVPDFAVDLVVSLGNSARNLSQGWGAWGKTS